MKKRSMFFILSCILAFSAITWAGSNTTHYNLYKPAVGDKNWGAQVNTNFDLIDSALYSKQATLSEGTDYLTKNHLDAAYLGITATAADSAKLNGQSASYYYPASNPSGYISSLSGAVLTDQTTGQTIGDTDHRLTKLWATDITVTNAISGSVTGNAGTVTNATLTTSLTNNGGAGVLTWPAAGATLTIPTGGGTLGSAAFTASTAYDPAGAAAAVTPTSLGLVIGTNVQAYDSDLTTWAGITPAAGMGTFLATPSSSNLASALSDETGTGYSVFSDSPIFTTKITNPLIIGSTVANGTLTLQANSATTGNTLTNPAVSVNVGDSGATNAITVLQNGNVGIGTTPSSGKFSVGSLAGENAYFFKDNAAISSSSNGQSLNVFRIDDAGHSDSISMYISSGRSAQLTSNVTMALSSSGTNTVSISASNSQGSLASGLLISRTNSNDAEGVVGMSSTGIRSGAGGNYTLYGIIGNASYTGTGTQTNAIGVRGGVTINKSGSTITNAYSIYASKPVTTAGSITNSWGMYSVDKLGIELDSANTSTVQEMQRITTFSTGTVAAGFGPGLTFYGEDASGNTPQIMGQIASIWTDPTNTSESSALTFSGVTSGGAITEWARLTGGRLYIGTTDSDGTPAVGIITAKGTTNDGTTNTLVLRDSDEVNQTWTDTNGNLTTLGTIKGGGYKSSDDTSGASATTGGLTFKNGLYTSGSATVPTYSKSFVITNPTATADKICVWRAPANLTIVAIHLYCDGAGIVGNMTIEGSGVDGATDITGVVDTNVNDDGSLSAAGATTGQRIGWRTTSATAGATGATITFEYTIP